ncbi:MAG: HNH endonuclease signature motif containing protein, partial [Bacteroidota bacterium]
MQNKTSRISLEDRKKGGLNCSKLKWEKKLNGLTIQDYALKNVFIKGRFRTGKDLKKYLFKCNFKQSYACEICGWDKINPFTNKPSTQLDHKDGDNTNNTLENLRFLCPNCHSLQATY